MTALTSGNVAAIKRMITVAIDAAIIHVEKRIVDRLAIAQGIREPTYPKLDIQVINSDPMKPVRFGNLGGGCVFRLENGTQPIMKLEVQSWGRPADRNANAYYLRTGSLTLIEPWKMVVPLKSTVTIDE